ncbi:MAG TPA: acetyl-CoA carboxylase biotin carboxyl carrier protein [Terriglobia bacterium]|jgi:acetyl-CoA carboxylase biotin carboxyl carrier protein
MNLKELKEIIDIVTSKETIDELEIEKSGVRLRIKRVSNHAAPVSAAMPLIASAAAIPVAGQPATPQLPPVQEKEEDLYYQKSPIVGTFYQAAGPSSEPFVTVGASVEKGAVLCIIEAMKLMNEIEADVAGEVVSVLVDNGQPVEYGEKLFAIRQR